MLQKVLRNFFDYKRKNSLRNTIRKRRFDKFISLVASLPRPIKILDIGGTQIFWETMGFYDRKVQVVILNLLDIPVTRPNFRSVIGDARDMKQFKDCQFDAVFSNSVIEHLGDYNSQQLMAHEIRRVGGTYFIQTPNRHFPIEPHFLFPFFQFFSRSLKIWFITHFSLGWYEKARSKKEAEKIICEIRLLSKKELKELFPDGVILEEKFLGLTKSFIAHNIS